MTLNNIGIRGAMRGEGTGDPEGEEARNPKLWRLTSQNLWFCGSLRVSRAIGSMAL